MPRNHSESSRLFNQARDLMPGGVSSPVRAYQSVGRDPIVIRSARGPYVFDVDGNQYIDYVGSFGPMILGHAAPEVINAVTLAATNGTSFGMPTELENILARMVIAAVPSIEKVRFVNSGTEAAMSAIRLARAYTGRSKIIKCTGCYHGHTDALLVQAGSGATTLGTPSSPGVPASTTANTILVPFNDLDAVRQAMQDNEGEIAAMAVEPIAGNMGCIPPAAGYLQGLRDLCDEHGSVLLFDEVMTGFRVHPGGAQSLYGVTPDVTCLGKIVGGGLPCAAYGASQQIMATVAPEGPMYQAGTLSGNPLAMAAGIAMLTRLTEQGIYEQLDATAGALEAGIAEAAASAGVPATVQRVGSMLTLFFTRSGQAVTNYADATACDTEQFAAFFRGMLDRGVVLPPSQYEAWFVSLAHDASVVEQTLEAVRGALSGLSG